MRLKRAILFASAVLLAGAAINVGVAWCISLGSSRLAVRFVSSRSPAKSWPITVPPDWPLPIDVEVFELEWGARSMCFRASDKTMARPREDPEFQIVATHLVDELWLGWPSNAFGLARVRYFEFGWGLGTCRDLLSEDPWITGIHLGALNSLLGAPPQHRLPIRPLWPGFAINTLLYTAAVSAPLALFTAVRRWRRRANLRCPACAYDLRGLAPGAKCPECGAAGA